MAGSETKPKQGGEARKKYVRDMEAELKELDARLDVLESEAEKADAESTIGYGEQIYELREKREHLRDMIADLEKAGEGDWKDLKREVDEAVLDFKTALDVACTRFE